MKPGDDAAMGPLAAQPGSPAQNPARQHPYATLPDYAFWQRAVAGVAAQDIDPVVAVPFEISPSDKVATAGSCFAQHISRHLRLNGFRHFVTEPPHPMLSEDLAAAYNYGTFTARYGNLYTARQLLQLFRRAHGAFTPIDDMWETDDGRFIDPYRPRIQPKGFCSREELLIDREQHFSAVRRAFRELDIFVFTFGLTEAWSSRADGAVYPLCPGVAGGTFDPGKHLFQNFSVSEISADMLAFIDELRAINPRARIILTVSPVPLVATCMPQHVLVSTTYSKSVLRVACETIARERENVAYFPSYEIIVGAHARGRYFAEDLRSVTEAGVDHVMRTFLRHFANRETGATGSHSTERNTDVHGEEMARLVQANCDEVTLDNRQAPSA